MDREGRAATTGNTYCGNLLWQSGLTLLAHRTTLIHELSHARDLCKARKPIKCGGVGSQDMKRLICTEIRAYRNAEGIRDKEACIDRAINSVQVVCRHKRGTWAEYRWHLKKEADKIYDECIKGVW